MKTLKVILQEVVSGMKAWVNSNFAQDSNTVHKNGNETINGVKTFSDGIVVANVAVDSIAWENITDKPSSFTPSSHTHDTSEITDFPTLATVATSGSYNDLSDKPTIPTVNNATLTIQKNGTDVNTFTANASSNVTANITVPTKTSDLTNDSGFLTSHQSLSNYVTLDGEQTITAVKAFKSDIVLQGNYNLRNSADNGYTKVQGGSAEGNGSRLVLSGKTRSTNAGCAELYATDGTNNAQLNLWPSGILSLTGNIETPFETSTYLNGNSGKAIINSTASAGAYVTFLKSNSTNGHFTLSSFQGGFNLYYTVGTETGNKVTKSVCLLNESGNSSFPGTVGASSFSGDLTGNVTGNCSGSSGSCTGNAATATTATKVVGTVANDNTDALVQGTMGTNDCFRIAIGGASNAGWAEIATGDDYNEPIYVRQYQGAFTTLKRTATLLDASGNTSFPGTVTATGFSGPLTGNVTGNCSGSSGSCTGNAATATQFSANTTVGLTGDATGTSGGSKKGWSIPVTLANSGVTAGTYGPSANVSGSNGATIAVPQITVDAKGRVTSITNRTYTSVNTDTNTDTLMTQNVSTTNATYPILLCPTANATANQGAKTGIFGSGVKVNPSTSTISATTFSGNLTGNVTGNCSGSSGSCTGNAANVTGTVAIAHGGTGATTRLGAVQALTNENVGTGTEYFLTITTSWGKAGYCSVANAKTVLGINTTDSPTFKSVTVTNSNSAGLLLGSYRLYVG